LDLSKSHTLFLHSFQTNYWLRRWSTRPSATNWMSLSPSWLAINFLAALFRRTFRSSFLLNKQERTLLYIITYEPTTSNNNRDLNVSLLRISIELMRYANDWIKVCNARLAAEKSSWICAPDGPEHAITSNFIYIWCIQCICTQFAGSRTWTHIGHNDELCKEEQFCR
jgi:hypothetical protein